MMFDFNLDGYQNLLGLVSKNYRLLNFSESREQLNKGNIQNVCCLRHDVDYCLQDALKMASLENKLNISSSYFFLVDSDNYNIFSVRSREIILNISKLGHEIGLHFDVSSYNPTDHTAIINAHKSGLELVSQRPVNNISYHNPGVVGLESLSLGEQYEGLYNTYSKTFNNAFHYVSDSLCKFRDPNIFEKIAKKEFRNLHFLIHPVCWCGTGETRDQKIQNVFEEKKRVFMADYEDILTKYGAKE